MPDKINTEVTEGETSYFSLDVKVGESTVTVKVSGYADAAEGLKALYLLGQPDRIMNLAAAMDDATEEHFGR